MAKLNVDSSCPESLANQISFEGHMHDHLPPCPDFSCLYTDTTFTHCSTSIERARPQAFAPRVLLHGSEIELCASLFGVKLQPKKCPGLKKSSRSYLQGLA